jgi:Ca2+/H+ antiporter, TMEM165/GDT1 family
MNSLNFEVFLSSLLGAGVELFEIVAIAYALARSGYGSEAFRGTLVGVALVGLCAMVLGPRLALIPIRLLQLIAGTVLLYFGWKWVKKSVIRKASGNRAGWIENPLRGRQLDFLEKSTRFSYSNFIVMFKSAALETFEVAVIVMTIALGSNAWFEAVSGAICALVLTVLIVLALHGHLLKLPDVLLKLGAGILLMTFGTFWLGAGVGLRWPLKDFSLIGLFALYVALSFAAIHWLQWSSARKTTT